MPNSQLPRTFNSGSVSHMKGAATTAAAAEEYDHRDDELGEEGYGEEDHMLVEGDEPLTGTDRKRLGGNLSNVSSIERLHKFGRNQSRNVINSEMHRYIGGNSSMAGPSVMRRHH